MAVFYSNPYRGTMGPSQNGIREDQVRAEQSYYDSLRKYYAGEAPNPDPKKEDFEEIEAPKQIEKPK